MVANPRSKGGHPQVAMSAVDLPAGVTQDAALDYFEKNLTTELLHIFNECGVPVGLQYKLGQHFKNVKKFSTYADSRSDVRAALKADHVGASGFASSLDCDDQLRV